MPKSANELYRESGSEKSFKDWLNEEKEKGIFIYNKHLNKKIEDMNKQHMFHQADGSTSQTAPSAVTPASNKPVSAQTKRDIKFLVLGAAVSLAVVIIVKSIRKNEK